jgi:hypothetical protein
MEVRRSKKVKNRWNNPYLNVHLNYITILIDSSFVARFKFVSEKLLLLVEFCLWSLVTTAWGVSPGTERSTCEY